MSSLPRDGLPALPPAVAGMMRSAIPVRSAYAEGAGIFRIVPRAVAFPDSVRDVQELIRWAGQAGVPLVPRGAGSGMAGGNVGDGVIVDLQDFDRSVMIDPARSMARTGSAATCHALNTAAAPHGLRMPAVPSSGRFATLGGMVSTNAAGARSYRYGTVRAWVDGVTLVTGDGEIVSLDRGVAPDPQALLVRRWAELAPRIAQAGPEVALRFPRTRKNSSGYALDALRDSGDLVDLIIGAEGTLGIVTEIRWRLQEIPAARRTLRVALRALDDLAPTVAALHQLAPAAIEWLDGTFLRFVAAEGPGGEPDALRTAEAVLLVEFEGDDAVALRAASERARDLLGSSALAIDDGDDAEAAERLWAIRHAASPLLAGLPDHQRSLQVIEDGAVPPERLGAYVAGVRGIAARHGVPAVLFGHAGDGHLHVNLLPDVSSPGWREAVAAVYEDAAGLVLSLGGTPSGEHGDGRLRAPLVPRLFGDSLAELFGRIRAVFDPFGVLNPGVKTGTARVEFDKLKTGDGAVPLPPAIAAGLRAIERTGGYATRRSTLVDDAPSPDSRRDSD